MESIGGFSEDLLDLECISIDVNMDEYTVRPYYDCLKQEMSKSPQNEITSIYCEIPALANSTGNTAIKKSNSRIQHIRVKQRKEASQPKQPSALSTDVQSSDNFLKPDPETEGNDHCLESCTLVVVKPEVDTVACKKYENVSCSAKSVSASTSSRCKVLCEACGMSFTKGRAASHRCVARPQQNELAHEIKIDSNNVDSSLLHTKQSYAEIEKDLANKFVSEEDNQHDVLESSQNQLLANKPAVTRKEYKRNTEITLFPCPHCSTVFATALQFEAHMTNEHDDFVYLCSKCGMCFTSASSLQTHALVIHKTGHVCEVCGRYYSTKYYLTLHRRIHSQIRDYTCSHCEKSFIDQQALRLHMRVHTGERPYACTICGRTFSQSSHRITHMRLHSGEKPYACRVCGKHFRQQSNVMEHERIHQKVL